MTPESPYNNKINIKLIALWALSESGLGGILFALHIPLTGFFVGGFAIVILYLLAYFSDNKFRDIINATVLVLMIKAMVSPHSPPPAYLAVVFQGFTAAVLFKFIKNEKLACYILAILSMTESCMQRVIMMTLVYGKTIWSALDKMLSGIAHTFHLPDNLHYSYGVIAVYVLLNIVWGLLIAFFAVKLPGYIDQNASEILQQYAQIRTTGTLPDASNRLKPPQGKLKWIFILLFILIAFSWSSGVSNFQILAIALRSIAAIFILYYILGPVLNWFIKKWLQKRDAKLQQQALLISEMLPSLRSSIGPCWELAKREPGKWKQIRGFVRTLLIVTIYE